MKTTKSTKSKKLQKEKFLHRIDINLSYLYYGEKKEYTVKDVVEWLKKDFHEGEIDNDMVALDNAFNGTDNPDKLKITLITDKGELKGFDETYSLYGPHKESDLILQDAINALNLHISVNEMIKRLNKVGYKVTT